MSRQKTTTPCVCSALDSPRDVQINKSAPVMLKPARSDRFDSLQDGRNNKESGKLLCTQGVGAQIYLRKSRRQLVAYSRSSMSSFARSKSLKHLFDIGRLMEVCSRCSYIHRVLLLVNNVAKACLMILVCACFYVHCDYSEDVGVKLERPADETMIEGETEVVGA